MSLLGGVSATPLFNATPGVQYSQDKAATANRNSNRKNERDAAILMRDDSVVYGNFYSGYSLRTLKPMNIKISHAF